MILRVKSGRVQSALRAICIEVAIRAGAIRAGGIRVQLLVTVR